MKQQTPYELAENKRREGFLFEKKQKNPVLYLYKRKEKVYNKEKTEGFMKKVVCLIVMLLCVTVACTICCHAERKVIFGASPENFNDGFDWCYFDDDTLYIDGSDDWWYSYTDGTLSPWNLQFRDKCKTIVIGDLVADINWFAFRDFCELTDVYLPSGLKNVASCAFENCPKLTDVYYSGSKSDWEKVDIQYGNECLTNATIHYGESFEDTPLTFELTPGRGGCTYDLELPFVYSDKWFSSLFASSSAKYNLQLAQLSNAVAVGAYSDGSNVDKNGDLLFDSHTDDAIVTILEQLGFDSKNTVTNEYNIKPTKDTIASAISSRTLDDGTTLIAVCVRGGGYEAEWIGDFEAGPEVKINGIRYHKNFLMSAYKVLERVQNYVVINGIDTSTAKIWVTGYSRGAAVANLTAHFLADNNFIGEIDAGTYCRRIKFTHLGFAHTNIFGYTYATPAPVAGGSDKNVYNTGAMKLVQKSTQERYKVSDILGESDYYWSIKLALIFTSSQDKTINSYLKAHCDSPDILNGYTTEKSGGTWYVIPFYTDCIFNHIGYSDFVPQVMPEQWGYNRYGTTYVLPNAVLNNSVYKSVKPSFSQMFRSIMKASGRSDEVYTVNDERNIIVKSAVSLLTTIIGSSRNYEEDGYQTAILGLLAFSEDLLWPHEGNKEKKEDCYDILLYKLISNPTVAAIIYPPLLKAVNGILIHDQLERSLDLLIPLDSTQALIYSFIYNYCSGELVLPEFKLVSDDGESIFDNLEENLVHYVADLLKANSRFEFVDSFHIWDDDYERVAQIVINVIKHDILHVDNLSAVNADLAMEHYPEVYLSWMLNLTDASQITKRSSYSIVKVACPTDVYVYDENDELVLSIVNDVMDGSYTAATVDSQSQKTIYLPDDMNYRIEILATDEGTMDLSCESYDSTGNIVSVSEYYEVPLTESQNFAWNISNVDEPTETLVTNEEEVLPDLKFNVSVSSAQDGSSSARTAEGSYGADGDNVTWSYCLDSGTLTLSGEGATADYDAGKAPWVSAFGEAVSSVTVSDGVTGIGSGAFDGCTALSNVMLADSVVSVGIDAFSDCDSLTDVYYAGSEEDYEKLSVESGNEALTNAEVHFHAVPVASGNCGGETDAVEWTLLESGELVINGIGNIESSPWDETETNITSVTVYGDISIIGESVFADNDALTSVTLPESLQTIGDGAFRNCENLKSITLPDSVTAIGVDAFACCFSLSDLVLPEQLDTVGETAFRQCEALKSVSLPGNVTVLGNAVFSGCTSLAFVSLPNSLEEIGDGIFENCSSLALFVLPRGLESDGMSALFGAECTYSPVGNNPEIDPTYVGTGGVVTATMTVEEESTAVEVTAIVMGDIDGDGGLSSGDALFALRQSAGLATLSEEASYAADVDRNETVSSADALNILRASVGLSSDIK